MGRKDVRLWRFDSKGQFSVKSFSNVLIDNDGRLEGGKRFLDFFCFSKSVEFLLHGEIA